MGESKKSGRSKVIVALVVVILLVGALGIAGFAVFPRVSDFKIKSFSLMNATAVEFKSHSLVDWTFKDLSVEASFQGTAVATGHLEDVTVVGNGKLNHVDIPLVYLISPEALAHCMVNSKIPLKVTLTGDLDATSWTGCKPQYEFQYEADCPTEMKQFKDQFKTFAQEGMGKLTDFFQSMATK